MPNTIPLTVGLIGCGNVGCILAERQHSFRITAAHDCIPGRVQEFSRRFGVEPLTDVTAFLAESFDVAVEAASVSAVREYAADVLHAAGYGSPPSR